MITRLLLAIVMTAALGTTVQPNSGIYEDTEDTTSFNTAYDVSQSDLIYAEVFGRNDSYDYIKYTATYSRSIFFSVDVSDNKTATIELFLASKGLSTPYRTFTSDDTARAVNMTYLAQGDTVYYRVRCSGECYWTGDLYLNVNPSGTAVYNYSDFNGYSIPHNDGTIAYIYYDYDSSVYDTVPTQNFTYKSIIEDAMSIWEACGKVEFVLDSSRAWFTITIKDDIDLPEVFYGQKIFGNMHYCSEVNIPGDILYYEELIYDCYIGVENPVAATIRDGMLGISVICMGLSLGIAMCNYNSYAYNQMRYPEKPFSCLGDGDIGSFIELWGDANED